MSNASDSGDPFINVTQVTGAPWLLCRGRPRDYLNNGYPNLVWSGNYAPTGLPSHRRLLGLEQWHESRLQPAPLLAVGDDAEGDEPDHGADAPVRGLDHDRVLRGQAAGRPADGEREPGDVAATLAFDILGPEIGASTGQTTRYRGFFLVDRLQAHGFDDTTPGSFRPAVVYRQMIE